MGKTVKFSFSNACPESKQTWFPDVPRCNLNDKVCVLELGVACPYFEDFERELREEENGNRD